MRQSITYEFKKYKWGWSVWVKGDTFRKQIASKLETIQEVQEYIRSINESNKI